MLHILKTKIGEPLPEKFIKIRSKTSDQIETMGTKKNQKLSEQPIVSLRLHAYPEISFRFLQFIKIDSFENWWSKKRIFFIFQNFLYQHIE